MMIRRPSQGGREGEEASLSSCTSRPTPNTPPVSEWLSPHGTVTHSFISADTIYKGRENKGCHRPQIQRGTGTPAQLLRQTPAQGLKQNESQGKGQSHRGGSGEWGGSVGHGGRRAACLGGRPQSQRVCSCLRASPCPSVKAPFKSLSLCLSPLPRLQTGIPVPALQALDEEAELRARHSQSA